MELEQKTYNLTRKLYSDARRLIANAIISDFNTDAIVQRSDIERLKETLQKLKNSRKD